MTPLGFATKSTAGCPPRESLGAGRCWRCVPDGWWAVQRARVRFEVRVAVHTLCVTGLDLISDLHFVQTIIGRPKHRNPHHETTVVGGIAAPSHFDKRHSFHPATC